MFHLLSFRNLIVIALIGFLMFSGVLEVQVHPDKIGGLGSKFAELTHGQRWASSLSYYFTQAKRAGEQKLIGDNNKRLDLALEYVHEDSRAIADNLLADTDTTALTYDVDLLQASIQHTKDALEKASADDLVARQADITASFQSAAASFRQLQAAAVAQADTADELNRLAESLASYLGSYAAAESAQNDSSVAGAQDTATSTEPTFQPAPDIPLSF